ncbi:MAG: Gfo/Idh/MocA family oxidoreductase [Formivibrio sp.]|nr:Gfo/Idh/MocA family oxidoreductase [Formivibrio sp.]
MVRIAVVGVGKMGLSLYSIINMHDRAKVVAICDKSGYMLDILSKYSGIKTYADPNTMLEKEDLDAVIIATPSQFHYPLVKVALEKGLHAYCEKPLTLDPQQSRELADLAKAKGLVNQVGYHNRFVGAFQEAKRLLDIKAIGKVSHILAEAYGPVVLRPKGTTWRADRKQGGGCIYDYAAHPLNLVTWFLGEPLKASGSVLNSIFSKDIDDEVYGTLYFDGGTTVQLSVNWSDESYRKMSTKISIWGSKGRIIADRQEINVYLTESAGLPEGYVAGWNARNTTQLTEPVFFYVRGEEYSAELDNFVQTILGAGDPVSTFESSVATDKAIAMLINDAAVIQ